MVARQTISGTVNNDNYTLNTSSFVKAGEGHDHVYSSGLDNIIYGGKGNDQIYTEKGKDFLSGDEGNDKLFGGRGHNILKGGSGDDWLFTNGGGYTIMEGGTGNDRFIFMGFEVSSDPKEQEVITDFTPSEDKIDLTRLSGIYDRHDLTIKKNDGYYIVQSIGKKEQDDLYTKVKSKAYLKENDFIFKHQNNDHLSGTNSKDVLNGHLGNDVIDGGNGNDSLYGGGGNDIIDGGNGNDTLRGEDGNDLIYSGSGQNIIDGGAGIDTISYRGYSKVQGIYVILEDSSIYNGLGLNDKAYNIENVSGTIQNDIFTGNNSKNIFDGGLGKDEFYYSGGKDVFNGSYGLDTVRYQYYKGNIAINLQNGKSGAGDILLNIENAVGGDGNDIIIGSNLANAIHGFGGNDKITALYGNDSLSGGEGDDILDGGSGNDQLRGSDGNDKLLGGDGNDFLYANTGKDILIGGKGQDVFVLEGSSTETFWINDFVNGEDKIDLYALNIRDFSKIEEKYTPSGKYYIDLGNKNVFVNTDLQASDFIFL